MNDNTRDLADDVSRLIKDPNDSGVVDRLLRTIGRIERDAYNRGYDARQAELVRNLRRAAEEFHV